jgi:hypothetical protein
MENEAMSERSVVTVRVVECVSDHFTVQAFIDRNATISTVIRQLKAALRKLGMRAHGDVDERVFAAVRWKRENGATYRQASMAVFGTERHHARVRYWDLKRGDEIL